MKNHIVERRINGGGWVGLSELEDEGTTASYTDENEIGPGLNFHYRITAMQDGIVICVSWELVRDVAMSISIDTPSTADDPRTYKINLSPAPRTNLTLEWWEYYTEGYSNNENKLDNLKYIGEKRTWNIFSNDTESPEYTAAIPNEVGCFTLVSAPKISLIREPGGSANLEYIANPESSTVLPVVTRPNGATALEASFSINGSKLPKSKYTLSWNGSGTLAVYRYGTKLSNPTTFTHEEWVTDYAFTTLDVRANDQAQNGDAITVRLKCVAPDENETVISTDSHKFFVSLYVPPDIQTVTVPVDEASGARYRKIALNGRPLKDEKPQDRPENDQQAEETFVDAMTLWLRHNVTDAYLPVSGSELSLSVRRNAVSEVWSNRFGLRPHERPDLPFGPGWSSNLTANVKWVSKSNDADYIYVTDENGAVYRYVYANGTFFPFPTARHEQSTYLTSLVQTGSGDDRKMIFTRKFDSVLEYEITTIDHVISQDRVQGSKETERTEYYRLVKITDRLGQVVELTYDNNQGQLVPMLIQAAGRPDQTLYIQIDDDSGLVTSIWDANWNRTQYEYNSDNAQGVNLLTRVIAPDGTATEYGYTFGLEPDQTPMLNGENTYIHCDVGQITDSEGRTHEITYGYHYNNTGTTGRYNYFTVVGGSGVYYPVPGLPRLVKSVILPGNLGTVWFENFSLVKLVPNGSALAAGSLRKTRVIDAESHARTYQWHDALVYTMNDLSMYYDGKNITIPKIVFYLLMTITHEGYGTESYRFALDAGLNIAQATDLSGNQTDYEYNDLWTGESSAAYHSIIPSGSGINGRYEDPTDEIRHLQ